MLPELDGVVISHGFIWTFGCAPPLAEVVELPDVGRLLTTTPGGGDALQVGRQAVRVADQRNALAITCQPSRLLHGQEGLTAAGTAADLDAV